MQVTSQLADDDEEGAPSNLNGGLLSDHETPPGGVLSLRFHQPRCKRYLTCLEPRVPGDADELRRYELWHQNWWDSINVLPWNECIWMKQAKVFTGLCQVLNITGGDVPGLPVPPDRCMLFDLQHSLVPWHDMPLCWRRNLASFRGKHGQKYPPFHPYSIVQAGDAIMTRLVELLLDDCAASGQEGDTPEWERYRSWVSKGYNRHNLQQAHARSVQRRAYAALIRKKDNIFPLVEPTDDQRDRDEAHGAADVIEAMAAVLLHIANQSLEHSSVTRSRLAERLLLSLGWFTVWLTWEVIRNQAA